MSISPACFTVFIQIEVSHPVQVSRFVDYTMGPVARTLVLWYPPA